MKKIIILLSYIFLVTGCTAHYELVYENNEFKESLKILSSKSEKIDNDINNYYVKDYIVDYKVELGDMTEHEYISKYGKGYNKALINENDIYGFSLGYNYKKYNDYTNSSIVYSLFKEFSISDNIISANNINNIFEYYPHLNEVKVSFKTDNNVIETNADETIDNVFYWYINKNNYINKNIYVKYSKNENLITEDGYLTGNIIKYIMMGLAIIILIFVPLIYEKVKKSNN